MFSDDAQNFNSKNSLNLSEITSLQCINSQQIRQHNMNNSQIEALQIIKRIEKQAKDSDQCKWIQLKYNKKKKKNQFINLYIEYPFKSEFIYHISGNILTEINPHENNSYQICVRKLEKTEQSYTIFPQNIKYLTDLEYIIFLLQNSQCQDSYKASILLQQYQNIIQNQKELCRQVKQELDEEQQLHLLEERNKFKNEIIKQHIEQNLKDEHFYAISNISMNIQDEVSYLEYVKFSKGLFYILGIEQKGIENLLFKQHILFLMLLPSQRKLHFVNQVKRYLHLDLQKQITDNFVIQTIDQIQVACSLESYYIPINYPHNLVIKNQEYFNISMDNIQVTIFNIPADQIKKVVEQRQKQIDHPFEDFEYSMLSQIFIEKYYTNHIKKDKKSDEYDEQKEFLKSQMVEYLNNNEHKRASYKPIKNQQN
ncbi:hypothetical protein TTHERM_00561310 (macronuclear) [Tetrahymena thermophila SB210]|uniref:Uncharacterized protein n=1 Tax=Tetrahymena thermophila (strain SB210) TaxID=312017 RepID=I7LU57_TETTS|nr:hypothetical protein TTHERM_00561310 [Tetrahymena thermophila SB210]EAR89940.2 hypothetical protein TTHERM_00561310 [Tetrahymena thermophila SB210]|eukprot:XP_001010185.2 hypothetical protein TTHERM_00561310 [Tetrahymena thermophila SB210]